MTLKQCQVNLPRSSSAFVISSPPAGSEPGLTGPVQREGTLHHRHRHRQLLRPLSTTSLTS